MRSVAKLLGILAVVLGAGAMIASAASATQLTSETGVYPLYVSGAQVPGEEHVLTLAAGRTVKCASTYAAPLYQSQAEVTLVPTFGACTAEISGSKFPATVSLNGCDFPLDIAEAGESETYLATTDLVCPVTKQVEIRIYESAAKHSSGTAMCQYALPPQANVSEIELINMPPEGGAKRYVTAKFNLAGLFWKRTGGSALVCGAAESSAATFTGNLALTATAGLEPGGEPQGIDVG